MSDQPPNLATRLREGTASAHATAEHSPFIEALFQGSVDRTAYGQFLTALRAVYAALEQGLLANAKDPRVGPLVRPEVFRVAAIDADLAFLQIASSAERPATRTYVDRLELLASTNPVLLVAHAYTRTLGDLSGGQLLKRNVQRALGLDERGGCAFYDFPQIPRLGEYKAGYRQALASLPLDEATQASVVAEAVVAFTLNTALTDGLGGAVAGVGR